jgi:nitrate/nitrite-specific signal transduction histidine kinase
MGLRIMAHRAAVIGAVLAVEAAVPRGTIVTCRLPLPTPNL